jgi:hypothetical protein
MKHKIAPYFFIFICLSNWGLQAQSIRFDKYQGKSNTIFSIRIASASIIPDKWEKNTNWLRIERMVNRAAIEGGANVVVTPECVLDGYVINEVNHKLKTKIDKTLLDRFFQLGEQIDGPYIKKASTLADELNIYLIFGFLEREDQALYNTAIMIDPDGDVKVLGNGGNIAYHEIDIAPEKKENVFRNRHPTTYNELLKINDLAK